MDEEFSKRCRMDENTKERLLFSSHSMVMGTAPWVSVSPGQVCSNGTGDRLGFGLNVGGDN